jgi:hypothetical protein
MHLTPKIALCTRLGGGGFPRDLGRQTFCSSIFLFSSSRFLASASIFAASLPFAAPAIGVCDILPASAPRTFLLRLRVCELTAYALTYAKEKEVDGSTKVDLPRALGFFYRS